jgi:hypothetical protein
MRPAGIRSGDTVIVDRGIDWTDGDIVIARFGEELVCKHAYRYLDTMVQLRPADANYLPLLAHSRDVVGVVTFVKKGQRFCKPKRGPSRQEIADSLSYWRLDPAAERFTRAHDVN